MTAPVYTKRLIQIRGEMIMLHFNTHEGNILTIHPSNVIAIEKEYEGRKPEFHLYFGAHKVDVLTTKHNTNEYERWLQWQESSCRRQAGEQPRSYEALNSGIELERG